MPSNVQRLVLSTRSALAAGPWARIGPIPRALSVGLAVLALSIWTLGFPATLLLLGGWQLAIGLSAAAPALDGMASWAAAIIAEVSILAVISGLTGLFAIPLHAAPPNLAILCVPIVVALLLRWRSQAGPVKVRCPRFAAPQVFAVSVVVVVLGVVRWIASLGQGYGIAWAMSGDARNEVLVMRSAIQAGGITVRELKSYPGLLDSIMAQVALAGGRTHLRPGQLMLHDASTLVVFYALACICIALMMAAALTEVLPEPLTFSVRDLGAGGLLVIVGAAATSATPMVLGTSLYGGFVVAYSTIPVLMASIVLALRFFRRPSPGPIVLLALAAVFTLFSWSVVVVIPASLDIVMIVFALRRWHASCSHIGWTWIVSYLAGGAVVVLLVGIGISQEGQLRSAMAGTGAIVPPDIAIGIAICILAVLFAVLVREPQRRWQLGSLALASILVAIVIWGIRSLGRPPHGTYYSMKTMWVSASSLLWLAFLPALMLLSATRRWSGGRSVATAFVEAIGGASWSVLVIVLIGTATSVSGPLALARAGWSQPDASVVTEVAHAGNRYRSFVLWQWDADSANDRLGNFWADLVWGTKSKSSAVPYQPPVAYPPGLPGGLYLWAYSDDADQLVGSQGAAELCSVVRSVPGVVVLTRDRYLHDELRRYCPVTGTRVVVTAG